MAGMTLPLKQSSAVGWGQGMSSRQHAPWLMGGESIYGFTWGPRSFADPTLGFGIKGWRGWASSELCLVAWSLRPQNVLMRTLVGNPGLAQALFRESVVKQREAGGCL